MSEYTIYERVNRGDYKSKLPYPDMPRKPGNLAKKASDLSDAELTALPGQKAAYEEAMVEYRRLQAVYNEDAARLDGQFWADLAEYCGITDTENPFYKAMLSIAYERGHSAGYSEIVCEMNSLLPLWKLYNSK